MNNNFDTGDKVEVINSSLRTYGFDGTVTQVYDNKVKVQFSRRVMNILGLKFPSLIFNSSNLQLVKKSGDNKVKPTENQELLLAKITQHDIHCKNHPNDLESKKHLDKLKKRLGNNSIKDIKKSLEPDDEIFYALYRTSKRFKGYQHVGNGTASSREKAQEALEDILLSLETKRSDGEQYHAIVRKLPTPVKLNYTMIKVED